LFPTPKEEHTLRVFQNGVLEENILTSERESDRRIEKITQ
jgi:hypothetical protein